MRVLFLLSFFNMLICRFVISVLPAGLLAKIEKTSSVAKQTSRDSSLSTLIIRCCQWFESTYRQMHEQQQNTRFTYTSFSPTASFCHAPLLNLFSVT